MIKNYYSDIFYWDRFSFTAIQHLNHQLFVDDFEIGEVTEVKGALDHNVGLMLPNQSLSILIQKS